MNMGLKFPVVSRRAAVQTIAAAVAGGCCSLPSLLHAAEPRPARHTGADIHFGAQTNAWRIDPEDFDSLLAVLGQIRRVGYAGFETGFRNVSKEFLTAPQARQRIESTGLTFFGIHVFLPPEGYDPGTKLPSASLFEKVARGGVDLGAKHLIFSSVAANGPEELHRKAEGLNTAGKFASSLGIPLLYHNEQNTETAGQLESLYAATDPQLVSFLLDAGHAYLAGVDVPALLEKHHRRIAGIHLRDFRDRHQVPLGQGTFPLAESASVLKHVGWSGWVLNEEEREDGTKAGLKYIEPAFQAARNAFGA